MLPLLLTIKGLYSYRQEQTIDFAKLSENQLFGIFGPVGCGKSSILEAITYALYGETERLNSKGDNRSYNMMNLLSNELKIDFVFKKSNGSEEIYRFTAYGKRSKDGSVKSIERSAYRQENDEWVPLPELRADNILKLSYDDFRRTVIIPQGKFKEFLELTGSERIKMLERIFNLNKFNLYDKAAFLKKRNDTDIEVLENLIAELANINPEKIEELKARGSQLNEDNQRVAAELNIFEKEEKELQRKKELFEKIDAARAIYSKLDVQKDYFSRRQAELSEYEQCLIYIKPVLDNISVQERKLSILLAEIDSKKATRNTKQENLKKDEENFIRVKEDFTNIRNLEKKKEEVGKIIEIKRLESKLNELLERIEKGNQYVIDTNNKIASLKETEKEILTREEEKSDKNEKLKNIHDILNWFQQKNNHLKNIEKYEREIKASNENIASVEREISSYLSESAKDILTEEEQIQPLNNIKEIMIKFKGKSETELEKQKETLEAFRTKKALNEFAGSLHEGEPCPLCGSVEHPAPLNISNIDDELRLFEKKYHEKEELVKSCDKTINRLDIFIIKKDEALKSVNQVDLNINSEKNALNELLKEFTWTGYDYNDEAKVRQSIEFKKQLESDLKAISIQKKEIAKNLEDLLSKKEKSDEKLNLLRQEAGAARAKLETYEVNFTEISAIEYKIYNEEELNNLINEISKNISKISSDFEKLEKEINSLRSDLSRLEGEIIVSEKQLESTKEELDNENTKLGNALKDMNLGDADYTSTVLNKKLDINKEKREIKEYEQNLNIATGNLRALEKESEDIEYIPSQHAELSQKINLLKQELDSLNRQIGACDNELKESEKKLETKKKYQADLAKLQKRGENISVLVSLFRSNGFTNYVSTVYLRNLLNAANDRFTRLTNQHFHLELKEGTNNSDNQFEICDHLNGGKTRHIKTLSGGQTFQASLSLALALSENISTFNNSNHNFFFLDEGFGTLDKESMQTVFETLRSLRKENRIVGIISHVEELQQEIENYLVAYNDPEKGSIITTSWE